MTCSICGYVCTVPECPICVDGLCVRCYARAINVEPVPPYPEGFVPKPRYASDGDFNDVAHNMDAQIRAGAICFFKFTCALCGSRQTFADPNGLHPVGVCEEDGFATDLTERGGGFALVMSSSPAAHQRVFDLAAEIAAEPNLYETRGGSA